ncbi:hypothetical protein BN59_03176 [Legionella massiliensis]|uniref:Uncharacterized protein n=1 Tax=Legionella massiliensis TaxID=1034943 RepID=A0A078L113_9GAMM|nr:hypothetical protein [Legionella massiliensis]CDZ78861.1 hypothetical protein BN59_03176 [Legionella massiliensis]CEE14599.1 hypothetical protein BN1094_03176 [Legionella massiliensis]
MPKLKQILDEFIDGKKHQGGSLRHAAQGAAFAEILKRILEEQGLLEFDITATQEFILALATAVQALRASEFGGYDHEYSFNNLRHQNNWPMQMWTFVNMAKDPQFHSQSDETALFESLFKSIQQGNIELILNGVHAHPEWLNQATSANHRSNLIIAALYELRQVEIQQQKRDNLLSLLEQFITQYGQQLNLGFRDASGNTALHRVFWYAIHVENEETAHSLADLGCKMIGLIRHTETYPAIMGMRNKQYYFARPQGETFIDNIYLSPLMLTSEQERNRDYLHAKLAPILNSQQESEEAKEEDLEPLVSFKDKSLSEQLEELLMDAISFETMASPMTLTTTGHTLDKGTWDSILATTKRNPLTNQSFEQNQLAINPVLTKVTAIFNQLKDDEEQLALALHTYFNSFENRADINKNGHNALIIKDILHITHSYFQQSKLAQASSIKNPVSESASNSYPVSVSNVAQSFFNLSFSSLNASEDNLIALIKTQVSTLGCQPGDWFDLGNGLELGMSNNGENTPAIRLGDYVIQVKPSGQRESLSIFDKNLGSDLVVEDWLKRELIQTALANTALNLSSQDYNF